MEKLSEDAIDARLVETPEWSRNGELLQRTFGFDDFRDSIDFVTRIAQAAAEHGHEPDIMVRSGKVTLTLTTHDAGGLTELDFRFAQIADRQAAA